MSTDRVFRKYARDNQNRPFGVATAIIDLATNEIKFGFALCSEADCFSYKMARMIAENRMKDGRYSRTFASGPFSADPKEYTDRYHEGSLGETFSDILPEISFVLNDAFQYKKYLEGKANG